MTEDGSRPLKKKEHEDFAVTYANEPNAAAAWVKATGGDAKFSDGNGSKWLKHGSIQARIAHLQAVAQRELDKRAEKSDRKKVLTLIEKREFMAMAVRTPLAEIDENSILCQSARYLVKGGIRGRLRRGGADEGNEEEEPEMTTVEIKMVDKLKAIEIDDDLSGEGAEAEANKAQAALPLSEMMLLPSVIEEMERLGWVRKEG